MPKKEKDEASQKLRDGDKDKAQSYNPLSANTSQPYTQAFKKEKYHKHRQKGHLTTGVNAIKIAKKDKDTNKAKNLSHIKYYTYKQKCQYAHKYSIKSKN